MRTEPELFRKARLLRPCIQRLPRILGRLFPRRMARGVNVLTVVFSSCVHSYVVADGIGVQGEHAVAYAAPPVGSVVEEITGSCRGDRASRTWRVLKGMRRVFEISILA